MKPTEDSWRFGRKVHPNELDRAVAHLSEADPRLRALIRRVGRIELRSGLDALEALMVSIMYQQLAASAADAITGRFKGLYGGRFPSPSELLATPDAKLRGTGLSRRKAEYMKDLCRLFEDGSLDLMSLPSKPDEEVITLLDEVKGIGRWTAQMFLIFPLGRMDVLPTGDLGIRSAVKRLYGLEELPSEEEVEAIGSKWHPYCTIASIYLWRLTEVGEGE